MNPRTYRDHPRPGPPSWSSHSVTGCVGWSSAIQLCSSCRKESCRPRTDRSDSGSTFCPVRSGWPSQSVRSTNKEAGPSWKVPAGWKWTASPGLLHQSRMEVEGTASGWSRIQTECRTCRCSRTGTERSWCRGRSATGTGSWMETCSPRGRSREDASEASAGDGGAGSADKHRSCRSRLPCPGSPVRCGAEWDCSAG